MSYRITYTCDRCGQTMTDTDQRHEIRIVRMLGDMDVTNFADSNYRDLCAECGNGLRAHPKAKA